MKTLIAGIVTFVSLSSFASEICTVQTQKDAFPLIYCSAKEEMNYAGVRVASQTLVSTLKILSDRKYKIVSATSLSQSDEVLYTLIQD
jgi:hypothetical protein